MDPIDRLRADLARTPDPRARLRRLADAQTEMDQMHAAFIEIRRDVIRTIRAKRPRLKWREIGDIFGVSLQRAHQYGLEHPTNTERTPT